MLIAIHFLDIMTINHHPCRKAGNLKSGKSLYYSVNPVNSENFGSDN